MLLLASSALADDPSRGRFWRFCSRTDQGRTHRGFQCDDLAFFEAFPASGAGTFGPCSTTAPTGARGETLTATRGSSAMCPKNGPATTGIQPGDLVLMSTNQPRVSYVGSLLTYLRESSRTNNVLRSQEIDNAAWANSQSGAPFTPVLNGADAVLAPDNTTTAEDYSFAAISGTIDYGYRFQTVGCPSGAVATASCYARSISGGTTIDLTVQTGAGSWTTTPCTIATTGYTQCIAPAITTGVGSSAFYVGMGAVTSATTRSAARVALWGCQCEAGAWASTYLPTTSATVTRSADSALTATLATGIGPRFSLGASFAMVSDSASATTVAQLGTAATDLAQIGRSTSTAASYLINATTTTPAVSAMGTSLHRISENDASGTRTAWWDNGSVSAPAASMVGAPTAISFGGLDTYSGRGCFDPIPGRCDL